ncbi:hypothetical protein [Bacteroides sp. 224]|uniref:hypothetical protein n=1 Tax=Bacteroides sp. 224 TaxID=2302936 RepID=UPI0013D0C423|nr:hypothetical protein [Bacteroides sp. 224]NDV65484.1 hypothetical protein [Bacteroides sp. 224]
MKTFRLLAILWIVAVCGGTIVSCKSSDKEPIEVIHPFVGKWERVKSEGWTTVEESWTDVYNNDVYTEKDIYEFNRDQEMEDGQYFIEFITNTEGTYINNRLVGTIPYRFPGDRIFSFAWIHEEKDNILEITGGGKVERIRIEEEDPDTLIFYYTSYNSAPDAFREKITSVFKRVK